MMTMMEMVLMAMIDDGDADGPEEESSIRERAPKRKVAFRKGP